MMLQYNMACIGLRPALSAGILGSCRQKTFVAGLSLSGALLARFLAFIICC